MNNRTKEVQMNSKDGPRRCATNAAIEILAWKGEISGPNVPWKEQGGTLATNLEVLARMIHKALQKDDHAAVDEALSRFLDIVRYH